MSKSIAYLAILICALFITNCAPARFVKPLEKNEWAVGANVGGPLIQLFDTTLPVPFSSLYAGYGYTDRTTIHGGLHTTSLAYQTLQIDAGATYLLRKMDGEIPGISLSGSLNAMMDFRAANFRAYPSFAGNLFYDLQFGRLYGGMENWIDLFPSQVPDNSQYNPWVTAFYIGQTIKIKKWEVNFEYKNLAPFTNNTGHVVRYARGSERGAHGIYVTLQKRF